MVYRVMYDQLSMIAPAAPVWTPQAPRVLGTAWDLNGATEKGAASNDGTLWTTGIVSRTLGAYQWGVRCGGTHMSFPPSTGCRKRFEGCLKAQFSSFYYSKVSYFWDSFFILFLFKQSINMIICCAKFFPANLPSSERSALSAYCALATGVNTTQFRVLRPTKLRECLGPCRSPIETPSYGWRVGRERGNFSRDKNGKIWNPKVGGLYIWVLNQK